MYDDKTNTCSDRIVSIYQPHVRPILRGKQKAKRKKEAAERNYIEAKFGQGKNRYTHWV